MDDGTEVYVDIISPRKSGMSPAQLVELFNKDQKRKSTAFSHPRIEGMDEALAGDMPLHAQNLLFTTGHFLESGIETHPRQATYCLLARKRGCVIGAVIFRIALTTEEDLGADRPRLKDLLSLTFDVHLDLAYVCARHRSKGYGKALMAAVTQVFKTELFSLCQQLAPVTETTGKQFSMDVCVHSDWASRSGKLTHMCLMDELDMVIDDHTHFSVEDEKEAVRNAILIPEHSDYDACY